MTRPLKIIKIGNSAGIILPPEVLAHLKVQIGENLSLVTTPRGIELSAEEPGRDAQMAAAREGHGQAKARFARTGEIVVAGRKRRFLQTRSS